MLEFHLANEADLTVATVMVPRAEGRSLGVLHTHADGRLPNFLEKPAEPPGMPGNPDFALASMGVYVFKAEVLVQEVIRDAKLKDSKHDFGMNIIPHMVGKKRVFAYNFTDPATGGPAYWRDIGQLDAYFAAHWDLLGENQVFDLFGGGWPIRGHATLAPPARYFSREKPVMVTDSLAWVAPCSGVRSAF